MKFYLVNVVWYDGVDAFVSKYILDTNEDGTKITAGARAKLENFLSGNGIILMIDVLYRLDLDNIAAYRDFDDERRAAYDRFNEMYF